MNFTLNPADANDPLPYWSTNFYTREINIDTSAPGITISSPLTVTRNQVVNASYECKDNQPGAGVVLCGTHLYATETTYDTGSAPMLTIRLNTSSKGSKSLTLYAVDGAGNTNSKTITYTVN